MKKELFFSVFLIVTCIFLNNCSKAPVYPDTPKIEFNSITRYANGDSIIITLNFKDGDGDLGLSSEDIGNPYNEYTFVKDGSGNYIKKGSSSSLPDFNCKNYRIGFYDADNIEDTVLILSNHFYNNFYIEIYTKQPNQSYLLFDISNICPDFNQRFPLLNPVNNKGPIEGSLSHTLKDLSLGFYGETLKFKIYIIDRALHQSNIIETPDIVLN